MLKVKIVESLCAWSPSCWDRQKTIDRRAAQEMTAALEKVGAAQIGTIVVVELVVIA